MGGFSYQEQLVQTYLQRNLWAMEVKSIVMKFTLLVKTQDQSHMLGLIFLLAPVLIVTQRNVG